MGQGYSAPNIEEQNRLLQLKINNANNRINNQGNQLKIKLAEVITKNDNIDYNSQIFQIKADEINEIQKKLDDYQREISTKGSLIDQTEKSLRFQNNAIKSLNVLFIASLCMIVPLMFMINGNIGPATFIGILLITIVVIGFIFAWKGDLFSVREYGNHIGSNVTRVFQETNKDIGNRLNQFNKIVRNDLYGSKEEWLKKNCINCKQEEDVDDAVNLLIKEEQPQPGIFYKDDSAPKIGIYPRGRRGYLSQMQGNQGVNMSDSIVETTYPTWNL